MGPAEDIEPEQRLDRRWIATLVAIVLVGVVVRVAYVLVVVDGVAPGLDAIWYQLQGAAIRHGLGFIAPTSLFQPPHIATAGFPPAYPAYQAVWQTLFGDGSTSVRLAGVVPGAATIAMTGVLARRIAGPTVGLAAAGIVALDPTLVAVDGSTMSENLTVAVVVAMLLLAHQLLRRPDGRRWPAVALGVVSGIAILSRQDLALLVVAVLIVLAWPRRSPRRNPLVTAAVVTAAALVVVVPWLIRNEHAVGSFTISTVSPSSALAGSYCDESFTGTDIGSWTFACVERATPAGASEVEVAAAQRSAATSFVRDHLSEVPLVALAREARVWGFWDPRDLARRDAAESRRYGWQLVSRPFDALLLVAGAAGLVLLRRRPHGGRAALLLLAPIATVALSAAITYGNPRFNAIAHPSLAIGAAIALCAVGRSTRLHKPQLRA